MARIFLHRSLLLPSKESAEPLDDSSEGDKALSLSLMGARLQLVAEVTVKSSINEAIALSAELLCDRAVALTECMRMLLLTGRESIVIDQLGKLRMAFKSRLLPH